MKKILFVLIFLFGVHGILAQSLDSGTTVSSSNAYNLSAEDFDKDGDIDFVVGTVWCSGCTAHLDYLINDGSNNFTKKTISKSINSYQDHKVETADINGDGYLDIIAVDTYNATNWIFDPSNNTFLAPTQSLSIGYSNYHSLGDINGDGLVDLINGNTAQTNYLAWWSGVASSSTISTTRNYIDNEDSSYYSVVNADFNGDGNMDVAVSKQTNGTSPYTASIYENDGSENFTEHVIHSSTSFGLSLNQGDLDGDGDIDLIYFDRATSELIVKVNPGNGSSTFSSTWTTSVIDDSSFVNVRYTYGIYPYDVDSDGDLDLIVSDDSSPYNTMYFKNTGSLNFQAYQLGTSIGEPIVKDFDGDGDVELLGTYGSSIKLYNFDVPVPNTLTFSDYNKTYGDADFNLTIASSSPVYSPTENPNATSNTTGDYWEVSSVWQTESFLENATSSSSQPDGYHFTPWIDSPQAWSAGTNDTNQYITLKLSEKKWIYGVQTQGRNSHTQWVTAAKIQYSNDNTTWTTIEENTPLNSDYSTKVNTVFDTPIHAQYIRINPLSWNGHISMRAGLIYDNQELQYSISDTDVATVSGSTVHLTGAGTAIITATQVGDSTYSSQTTTFTLTVAEKGEITAPSELIYTKNQTNAALSDFVVNGYLSDTTLLVSIGLDAPSGTTFSLPTTTNLSFAYGYSDWTDITSIGFTGTIDDINTALAAMTLTTGSLGGSVSFDVSVTQYDSDYFYNPTNGNYYKNSTANATYATAKSTAAGTTYKGETGYLTTITSAEETTFINSNTSATNIWIALTDSAVEGTFKWDAGPENGQTASYTNWAANEPNDAGSGEDHVVTKWSGGTQWNDYSGTNSTAYLIEYGDNNSSTNEFDGVYAASVSHTILLDANLSIAPNDSAIYENDFGKYIIATSSSTASISYSSSDTSVATIDSSTGSLTIIGTGTTLIAASQTSNTTYNSDTASVSITVNASSLTNVYTDLGGFWDVAATSGDKRGVVDHNLIGFEYNGEVFATGVDNQALTDNSVSFNNTTYRALPINQIQYASGNTTMYQTFGGYLDGNNDATSKSYYENTLGINVTNPSYTDLAEFLTEGERGLGMRGLANIPSNEPLEFVINDLYPQYIEDDIPDVLITTIANPGNGETDYVYFEDVDGNLVSGSSKLSVIFSNQSVLANYETDRFKMDGSNPGQMALNIRSIAYKLSDFGIDSSNYSSIHKLVVHLASGDTDPAFVAYHQPSFSIASDLEFTQDATQYYYDATVSPTIQVQLKDTNGANVEQSGLIVTASVASGTGTLSNYTATTTASGTAVFDQLSIVGNEDLVLNFTASGLTTASTTLSIAQTTTSISSLADRTVAHDGTVYAIGSLTTNNSLSNIVYSSSNTSIATIDSSTGSITTVALGTTVISASQEETNAFSSAVSSMTLTVDKITPSYTVTDVTATYGDNSIVISTDHINLNNDEQNIYDLNVSSSNTSVATVSTTGDGVYRQNAITLVGVGTSILTLSHDETNSYKSGTVTLSITVEKATPVFDNTSYGILYGEAGENNTVSISTPNGELITEVTFASYGTPSGSGGDYELGTCHATNSKSIVENVALGTSSFQIAASNSIFGDPCGGTVKKLAIVVKYDRTSYLLEDQTVTYGVDDFDKIASTASDGTMSFTSSDTDVIAVSSSQTDNTATVTHQTTGVGSAVITVIQPATTNYNAATTSYTVTVNKKSLTIDGITGASKSYDGSTSASLELSSMTVSGIVGDDSVTVTPSGTYLNASGGISKSVSITYALSGTDAGNYTASGQVTTTASITDINNVLHFDGTNDNINVLNGADIYNNNKDAMTIEFWINPDTHNDNVQGVMYFSSTSSQEREDRLQFRIWNHTYHAKIANGNNTTNAPVIVAEIRSGVIADNSWHHVAIVLGDLQMKLYVDGTLIGTDSYGSLNGVYINSLRLGQQYLYSRTVGLLTGNYFKGKLDQFRIWEAAKTQSEIQDLMNSRVADQADGLALHYNFDQGTAGGTNTSFTSEPDLTANGYTASLINFARSGTSSNYVANTNEEVLLTSDFDITESVVSKTFGASSFTLNTTSSGTGIVSWSSADTNIASISGTTISIVGTGTVTLTAIQAADSVYSSGSDTVILSVAKADPVISDFNDRTDYYNNPNYTLTATSSSTGAITYSSSDTNVATISGSLVSIVGAGTTVITASQDADSYYNSATTTSTLTVNKLTPDLEFDSSIVTKGLTQIGTTIKGLTAENLGYETAISSDGTIMAVSSPLYDGTAGTDTGIVRIYQNVNDTWTQIGAIEGESAGEKLGDGVALSSNGSIIALSSRVYSSSYGRVKVYQFSNSSWSLLGSAIDGAYSLARIGWQLALSADGLTLAYSNPFDNSNAGKVYLKRFVNNSWVSIGELTGSTSDKGNFGFSIDLSSDGNNLVVGSYLSDTNGLDSGKVSVYRYDEDNWTQLGSDLEGIAAGSTYGKSVSISGNGNRVAIGANSYSNYRGVAQVFEYSSNAWQQLGSNIYGAATGDQMGLQVSLSNDGNELYVTEGRGHTSDYGSVKKYVWGSSWTQEGSTLYGTITDDFFGRVLDSSYDGDTFVAGTAFNDDNATNSGYVKIYRQTNSITKTYGDADFSISASSSSSGTITYSSADTNVATISGNTIAIIGTGTVTITATQASDTNYNGDSKYSILTVHKAAPIITTADLTKYYGDAPVSLTITSTSDGTVTYSSNDTNVATVSGSVLTIVGSGSTTIEVSQAATTDYNTATSSFVLTVNSSLAPSIITQPSTTNQYLQPNATASSLSVLTENSSGLSYQWYKNTTNSTSGGVLISGATSASYTPVTSEVGSLYYYVVVSRTNSSTSSISGKVTVQDDTLEVSYDFSNTDSYGGSGTSLVDLSGNSGRNATINGDYSFADNALTLQANNSTYINTPAIPYTGLSNQSFTIVAEVTPLSTSGNIVEMSNTNNSDGAGWNMPPIASANSNIYGHIYNNNTLKYSNYTIGSKYVIMLIFDYETQTQQLYVDGELISEQKGISYSGSGASNYFFLGQYSSGCCHTFEGYNSGNWHGKFHKFEVYSKGLSRQEAEELADVSDPNLTLSDYAKTYNDEGFTLTATSSSTAAVTFESSNTDVATISDTTVTIIGAGTTVITASQSSTEDFISATATATLKVAKDDPVLTGLSNVNKTFNDVDFSVSATSSSTGLISYSSSDSSVATISGTTVTIVGAGSTVITASQVSDDNYNKASVSATLTVAKDEAPISGYESLTRYLHEGSFELSASSSSTAAIVYSSSDTSIATLSDATVSVLNPGETIITIAQEGDANYLSSTSTFSLTLLSGNPEISNFEDLLKTYNDDDFELSATSTSSGTISYSSSDTSVATISGTTVTIQGAGTTVIELSQDAFETYLSATESITLTVLKDDAVIRLDDLVRTYNDANFELSATSSSTGKFSYSSSDTSVATISGTVVSLVGAGTAIITTIQETDANYNSGTITSSLTVMKDTPSISVTSLVKSYGDEEFTLDSSVVESTSPAAMSFSSSNTDVATIDGLTVAIVGGGTTVISVVQASSANYESATASLSLKVNQISSTVSFDTIEKTYGDASFELSPETNSSGAISYSSSDTSVATISDATVTIVGSGSSVITMIQEADANYFASTHSMTITVAKKQLTVKGIEVEDKVYDGTMSATVNYTNVVYEGIVSGDDISIETTAAFITASAATSKTVNLVSSYKGVDRSNYAINDQTTSIATIAPKTLNLKGAENITKEYDGTTTLPSSTIGYQALEGLVEGDEVLLVGKPSFDAKDVGQRAIVRSTLELSGAKSPNYTLNWTDGSAIISKKTLYVIARNDAKFVTLEDEEGYRGVAFNGFVSGESSEDLSGSLVIERTNAGVELADEYSKVLQPSGLSSSNYKFNYIAGNYTIVPADYLLLEVETNNTVYSETPSYTITGSYLSSTTSDVVYLDNPVFDSSTGRYTLSDGSGGKVSFEITAATTLSQSGKSIRPVSKSGFIQSGTYALEAINVEIESDNFKQEVVTVGDITVVPKTVVATLEGPIKIYDGGTGVPFKEMNISGVVEGDELSANYVGKYAQSNVGVSLTYSITDIELSGEDKISYILSSTLYEGSDGRINKAPLTVNATKVSKVYDGTTASNLDHSINGFVTGEDVANLSGLVSYYGDGTSKVDVGTYSYTLSGYSSSNYQITYSGSELTITAAPIQVSGIEVLDKVYDGTTDASVDISEVTFEGIVEGEIIKIQATSEFETATAGRAKTVNISSIYSGDDRLNYSITDQLSTTATINKAPLTVSVASVSTNYIGVPYPEFSVTYDGFVNGETKADLGGALSFSGAGTTAVDKGVYQVIASGLTSDNYEIAYVDGTYTVIDGDIDGDGIGDYTDGDIDGDGILNECDVDIDADGSFDNGTDNDNDGVNDSCDTDDDNDGVLDTDDAFPKDEFEWDDTDSDGVGNNADADDDNDKMIDTYEISCGSNPLDASDSALDTDGDHIPNCIDTDDDGDGVADSEDDFPLIPAEWLDTDGDGIGNNEDADDDNDGQLDVHELECLSDSLDANELALDTDGDSIPNCVDTDDDNDGLLDVDEVLHGTDPLLVDTDNDGVLDSVEIADQTNPLSTSSLDVNHQTEEEGTLNWNGLDPDGDGLLNQYEIRELTTTSRDPLVEVLDTDNDGIDDFLDADDDGDGILTKDEFSDPNLDGNPTDANDYDLDGIPDYLDADDDNDGTLTLVELEVGTNHLDVDSDDDAVTDTKELSDGTNPLDACSLIVNHQTEDTSWWNSQDCDNDGLVNANEIGLDTDGDGLENFIDSDDDGDGLATNLENAANNLEEAFDADYDGIPDYLDYNKYTMTSTVADDIEIYNAMSPNGDGLNDVFVIRNIEKYPDNELMIFNRWGKEVYRQKGYGTFSRFYDGVDVKGQTLPVGTYLYILKVTNEGKEVSYKGYLYINR